MGEVYLARHPRLPRCDALKLLGSQVSADVSFRERFLREADLASTLWHQHIVGVHDRGEHQERLWISMDFVDGADASKLMAERYPAGMPLELVIAIVTAVGSALDYAYKQGLLHRDVKPANILITNVDDADERRIMLTDFGIARAVDDVSGLTATNMTIGTVAYTAPEQLKGDDIDGRADQYSLAATAYHLLTGTPPFGDSTPAVVIGRHITMDSPPLAKKRPELAPLDPVLATALAKNPNERFTSCSEFARNLAAYALTIDDAATRVAPTMEAPTTPPKRAASEPTQRAPAPPPKSRQEPPPLPPGWYPDPSGKPGTLYWDGRVWRTGPPPVATGRPATLIWTVCICAAIVMATAIIGAIVVIRSGDGNGSTPTAAPSTFTVGPTPSEVSLPSYTTSTPPLTTTYTTMSPSIATPPPQTGYAAVIVGTCDEGGTCGVQQRIAPYINAPPLVPNALQDGMTVIVVCQTLGDLRTSAGHAPSNVWFRLSNGAYVSAVYMNLTRSLPECSSR